MKQKTTSVPASNYTQIPNAILDSYAKDMGEAELKVCLAIARFTFGWHRQRVEISVTKLQEQTGMSRQGVINGLEKIIERGLVTRTPASGQGYLYSMGVHDVDTQNELVNEVDQLECQTSQRSRPVLVNEVDQLDAKLVNEVDQLGSVFTPISDVAKESILKKEIKKTTINTQKNTENAKGRMTLTDIRYAQSVVSSELSQEDNSSVPVSEELSFQEKQTYSELHKEKPFSVKGKEKVSDPNEETGIPLKPVLNHNSSLCEQEPTLSPHKECASAFDQLKQEYEAPSGKKAIINWGETGKNIKAWLKAGYSAEDLRVVFVALKQDGWRTSALTMSTIVKEGPNILAKQTPKQSSGEVANLSDMFDAATIAAMGWDA